MDIVNHDWMVMAVISPECHQMRMIVRKIGVLMRNVGWIAVRPKSRRQTNSGKSNQGHGCKCLTHSDGCTQLPGQGVAD